MTRVTDQAWVTLATNDSYALGALVLGHSLQNSNTTRTLVVMITPSVSPAMRNQLGQVFHLVQEVDVMDSRDSTSLALLARPDLGITFTKLNCWKLIQFTKCVFLDADTMVLQHCDELFEREEFSAAPDAGWPDCFNSGVFIFRPSVETYESLVQYATSYGSFDGGDQGLLNTYFSDWATKDISKHLPFLYNMCATATYTYLPAYRQYGKDVKIIHFIGASKPWMQPYDESTGEATPREGEEHLKNHLSTWWYIFMSRIKPCFSKVMKGPAAIHGNHSMDEMVKSPEETALEDRLHREAWERGEVDYMGIDAFENILQKIAKIVAGDASGQHQRKTGTL